MDRRYIIIGAGAIGGAIGGRLALAGLDAVLVARGAHLTALQSDGLRIRTPTEDFVVRPPAVGGPAELALRPNDVFVLSTKTQQANEALLAWADVDVRDGDRVVGTAGEVLPILTALNGVAAEAMAQRYFRRVFGVCVWMPAVHLVPGEVIIRSTPLSGLLHVGPVPARGREEGELLADVARDWAAANYDVRLPAEVMPWKYRKLISNIGNVFQALVSRNGDWRPLATAAEAEARQVLDAAGIAFTNDADESAARAAGFTMQPVPGVVDDPGGSTWQSLVRGTGNVETDYLNGEIATIAHRIGTAAPLNATLATLARRAAARRSQPGDLSAAELATLLGLPSP
ncbi:MAG TPA: 2-dehydropantoate 2-reductase N-terminal domain-containing protein [Propionibacteriaceae bacterium]